MRFKVDNFFTLDEVNDMEGLKGDENAKEEENEVGIPET